MKKLVLLLYLIMPSVLVFIFDCSRFDVYMLHLYSITSIIIYAISASHTLVQCMHYSSTLCH